MLQLLLDQAQKQWDNIRMKQLIKEQFYSIYFVFESLKLDYQEILSLKP